MITDPFSGGDGDPGANWTSVLAAGKPQVLSGALNAPANGTWYGMRYSGASWSGAQSSSLRFMGTTINGSTYLGLLCFATGADSTLNAYYASFSDSWSTLYKIVNGALGSPLIDVASSNTAGGTRYKLVATPSGGTTILELYRGTTLVGSYTDSSSPFQAGEAGLTLYDANGGGTFTVDDWEGTGEAASATVAQQAFRFGADDGSESAHTWLAAQNANVTRALDTNTLLRFLLQATGDPGAKTFEIQYRRSTDPSNAWKKVT